MKADRCDRPELTDRRRLVTHDVHGVVQRALLA
jgi:hypothetical protein